MGQALERPKSLTTTMLEKIAKGKAEQVTKYRTLSVELLQEIIDEKNMDWQAYENNTLKDRLIVLLTVKAKQLLKDIPIAICLALFDPRFMVVNYFGI